MQHWNSTLAITRIRGVLVVTLPPDLAQQGLESLRQAVLGRIAEERIGAVVLDFSAVDVISAEEFRRVRGFLQAIQLMGAESAIVSLAAGVVLYLTEIQADTAGLRFFFGLDEALQHFSQ